MSVATDLSKYQKIIDLSKRLDRCQHLLKEFDRQAVHGPKPALYLAIAFYDGISFGMSWDFDNEINNHLLPVMKDFLQKREQELMQEIDSLNRE